MTRSLGDTCIFGVEKRWCINAVLIGICWIESKRAKIKKNEWEKEKAVIQLRTLRADLTTKSDIKNIEWTNEAWFCSLSGRLQPRRQPDLIIPLSGFPKKLLSAAYLPCHQGWSDMELWVRGLHSPDHISCDAGLNSWIKRGSGR